MRKIFFSFLSVGHHHLVNNGQTCKLFNFFYSSCKVDRDVLNDTPPVTTPVEGIRPLSPPPPPRMGGPPPLPPPPGMGGPPRRRHLPECAGPLAAATSRNGRAPRPMMWMPQGPRRPVVQPKLEMKKLNWKRILIPASDMAEEVGTYRFGARF
jgi:hypothetical protein